MVDKRPRLTPFGTELRRLRTDAGLTLTQMSALVHYSKSHLSKVENHVKAPSVDLARRCDAVLGASGALAGLVPTPARDRSEATRAGAGEVWMMTLAPDGGHEFGMLLSTDMLGVGAAPLMSWTLAPGGPGPPDEAGILASFAAVFDHVRTLGQNVGPSDLVSVLIALTNSLRVMATRSRPPVRAQLLVQASRFAEYTGWMAQEKGDDRAALWWTDQAAELAAAGGDGDMVGYANVRRALVALYRHDPIETVALARKAQSRHCHPRVRGLGAQREAQGHAIAGDYDACRRALDRAAALMRKADVADGPVFGSSTVVDPVAIATGWCLHDLGRSREAVAVLGTELARIPDGADRARARFGARLALALASTKDIERSCAVVEPILDTIPRIDSATIRTDLRHLARTLNRWHADPSVRRIMPQLTAALRSHVSA